VTASEVCAVDLGVLLWGSDLADRWRIRQSQRSRIVEMRGDSHPDPWTFRSSRFLDGEVAPNT
jgi:hypothetical protein